MPTPIEDAAHAVQEAREAAFRDCTLATINRLVNAVRAHDATIVRADTGHIPYGSAEEYAIRHAALIDPTSPLRRTETTR